MAFTEDLEAFLEDFGLPAKCGDSVATVLFDRPEANILGDRVQSTKYSITFRTGELKGLKHGSWVDVDGKQYSVITGPNALDDGAFSTAELQAS